MNKNLYVICLLNIWMKQKMNRFYVFGQKNKNTSLSNGKLKFNLEPNF